MTNEMIMNIGVGIYIDGVNVKISGSSFGGSYIVMPYKVRRSNMTHFGEIKGRMVDISINSKDMVSALEDMGYEVTKTEKSDDE